MTTATNQLRSNVGGAPSLTAEAVATPPMGRIQLYGPFALAVFLLATSKWGSYLPFGHAPYVADIVLGILLLGRAARSGTGARPQPMIELVLWSSLAALLVWSAIILVFSTISENALRDAAPYFYAVIAFLVRPMPANREHPLGAAITAALVFHATWVTVAQLAPSFVLHMPTIGGINIFTIRTDFDSVGCGLLATLSLHRALIGRRPAVNLLLTGWGTAMVLALNSRAGLLAFLVQGGLIMFLAPARKRLRGGRDNRLVIAAIILCLPLIVVVLGRSTSIERATTLVGINSTTETPTQVGAAGTARARRESWQLVIRYIESNTRRELTGVGFGPDFLHDSGGDLALLGGVNQEVRSPHNYLLNTWARLGLVGLGIVVAVIAAGLRLVIVVRRAVQHVTDIDTLALLIVLSIPVAAVVGVLLESPFGALPYFWALGYLSVRACGLCALKPFSMSMRGSALVAAPPGWSTRAEQRR